MKAVAGLAAVTLLGLASFEITMQPTSGERFELFVIFGAIALLAGGVTWWLPRWQPVRRSLRTAVVGLGVAAALVVAVAAALSAQLMFLSVHDLTLLLVVLGFGTGAGVVIAITLAEPMARDLDRIRNTAHRVGDGDLDARTGVTRPDELGAAASAVDGMVSRLAAAEDERSRSERARREFLAAVGHDLRTPVAALRAAIEALEDGIAPDPDRYLASMRSDVNAMANLVEDLFLLARIEAGKLEYEIEHFDLAEIADESLDALRPLAMRREVRLGLVNEGRVPVEGGARELGRVIRNLIENAIRHAPSGSAVTVKVTGGEGAQVIVADQGPGFARDMTERSFAGFVTGDPARSRSDGERTGLGLAIAHGIVVNHGGRIWAEPGPGGHVAFWIPGAAVVDGRGMD